MENQGSIGDIFGKPNKPKRALPEILSPEEFDALGLQEISPTDSAFAQMQEKQFLGQLNTGQMLEDADIASQRRSFEQSFQKPEILSPEEFQARGLQEIDISHLQQKETQLPAPFYRYDASKAPTESGMFAILTKEGYKPAEWDAKARRFYTEGEPVQALPSARAASAGAAFNPAAVSAAPKPRSYIDESEVMAIAPLDSVMSQIGESAFRQAPGALAGMAAFMPAFKAGTVASAPLGPWAPAVGLVAGTGAAMLAGGAVDYGWNSLLGDPKLQDELNRMGRPWVDQAVGTGMMLPFFRPSLSLTGSALRGNRAAQIEILGGAGMNVGQYGANQLASGTPENILDPGALAKEFALGLFMQKPTRLGQMLPGMSAAKTQPPGIEMPALPEPGLGGLTGGDTLGALFGDGPIVPRSRAQAAQLTPQSITPNVNNMPGGAIPPVNTAFEYFRDDTNRAPETRGFDYRPGALQVNNEVGSANINPPEVPFPITRTDSRTGPTAMVNTETALPGPETTQNLPYRVQLGTHSNIMGGVNSERGITPHVIRFAHDLGLRVGAVNNQAVGYWIGENGVENNPTTQFNIELSPEEVQGGKVSDAIRARLDAVTSAAGLAAAQKGAGWVVPIRGVVGDVNSWTTGIQLSVGKEFDVHQVRAISQAISKNLQTTFGLSEAPAIGVMNTAGGLRFIDFDGNFNGPVTTRKAYARADGTTKVLTASDLADAIAKAYDDTLSSMGDAEVHFFHFDSNYIDSEGAAVPKSQRLTQSNKRADNRAYGKGYRERLVAVATPEQLRGVDRAIQEANRARQALAGNADVRDPGLVFSGDGLPYDANLAPQQAASPLTTNAMGELSAPARPPLSREVNVPPLSQVGRRGIQGRKERSYDPQTDSMPQPPRPTPEQAAADRGRVDTSGDYPRPDLAVENLEKNVAGAQLDARLGADPEKIEETISETRAVPNVARVTTESASDGNLDVIKNAILPALNRDRRAKSPRASAWLRNAEKFTGTRLNFETTFDPKTGNISVNVVTDTGGVVARSTHTLNPDGTLYGDRLDVNEAFQGQDLSKAVKAEAVRRLSDALAASGIDWSKTKKPRLIMQDASDNYRSTMANDAALAPTGGMDSVADGSKELRDAMRGDEVDDGSLPPTEPIEPIGAEMTVRQRVMRIRELRAERARQDEIANGDEGGIKELADRYHQELKDNDMWFKSDPETGRVWPHFDQPNPNWPAAKKEKFLEIYEQWERSSNAIKRKANDRIDEIDNELEGLNFSHASGEIVPGANYMPEDMAALTEDQLLSRMDRLQTQLDNFTKLKEESPGRFESMGGERTLGQIRDGYEALNKELAKRNGVDLAQHERDVQANNQNAGLDPVRAGEEERFLGDDMNALNERQRTLVAEVTKGTTVGKTLEILSQNKGVIGRLAKALLATANKEHLRMTVDKNRALGSFHTSPTPVGKNAPIDSSMGAGGSTYTKEGKIFLTESHLSNPKIQEQVALHEVIHGIVGDMLNRAIYGRANTFRVGTKDVMGSVGSKYLNRLRAAVKTTSTDANVRRIAQAYLKFLDSNPVSKKMENENLLGDSVDPDKFLGAAKKNGADYGMLNLHEFVSEGLTNPEFRKKLAAIKVGNASLLGMVRSAVAKIFGLKGKEVTLLDELADATLGLSKLSHSDISRPGEEFRTNLRGEHKENLARRGVSGPTADLLTESAMDPTLDRYGLKYGETDSPVPRAAKDIRADLAQEMAKANPDRQLIRQLKQDLAIANESSSEIIGLAADERGYDIADVRKKAAVRFGVKPSEVTDDMLSSTIGRMRKVESGEAPGDQAIDSMLAKRKAEDNAARQARLDKELAEELGDIRTTDDITDNASDEDYGFSSRDVTDDMGDVEGNVNYSFGEDLRSGRFAQREIQDTRRRVQVAAEVLRRGKMTPKEAAELGARTVADVVSIKWLASTQAELNTLANRTNSSAARELSDLLNGGQAGSSGRAVRNGFHSDVSTRNLQFRNKMADAVREFQGELKDLDVAGQRQWLEDLGRAVAKGEFIDGKWVGARHPDPRMDKAVQAIRNLYRELYLYQRNAGIEVGNFGETYLTRMLNNEAVIADRQGFLDAAQKAYETTGMDPADARDAAADWWSAVQRGDSGFAEAQGQLIFDGAALNGEPKHTRDRVFGPSGEAFMERFYNRNIMDSTTAYINRAVRNAEMSRRFGADMGKYRGIQQRFIDEGHGDRLREMNANVASQLGAATAQDGGDAAILRLMNTYSAIHFLPRATFSSLSEPAILAVRTGRVRDMWNAYKDSAVQFVRQVAQMKPDYATKLAEDLGVVMAHLSDASHSTSLDSRYFTDTATRGGNWLASQFFRRTGLAQWTEGTRVASIKMGERFLHRLAEDVLDNGATKASSIRYLQELGVQDPVAFSKFVRSLNQKLPGRGKSADARRQAIMNNPTKQNAAYRDALVRFSEQTIMNPNKGTRPRWANHPLGGVIFNLQSYLYAFHENVNKRLVRQLGTAADLRNELNVSDRLRMAKPIGILGATVGIQYILNELRNELFTDPARRKEEPDSVGTKFGRALSRANLIGRYDFIVNAAAGLKYDKEPATVMAGPVLGLFSEAFKAGVDYFSPANSQNTNTAERRMARLGYDTLIQPTANAAFSALPGGWMGGMVGASGIQASSHPGTREAFVEDMAGPPVAPKKRPTKRSYWDDVIPDIVADELE